MNRYPIIFFIMWLLVSGDARVMGSLDCIETAGSD
jgi:hypothetical protein